MEQSTKRVQSSCRPEFNVLNACVTLRRTHTHSNIVQMNGSSSGGGGNELAGSMQSHSLSKSNAITSKCARWSFICSDRPSLTLRMEDSFEWYAVAYKWEGWPKRRGQVGMYEPSCSPDQTTSRQFVPIHACVFPVFPTVSDASSMLVVAVGHA